MAQHVGWRMEGPGRKAYGCVQPIEPSLPSLTCMVDTAEVMGLVCGCLLCYGHQRERESGDDGVALLRGAMEGRPREARLLCLRTSSLPDLKIDRELSDRLVTYKLSFLPSFSSSSCLHTSTSIELLYQTTIDYDRVLHTRTSDKLLIINFTTTAIMDSGAPQNNQNTNASGRRRSSGFMPAFASLQQQKRGSEANAARRASMSDQQAKGGIFSQFFHNNFGKNAEK